MPNGKTIYNNNNGYTYIGNANNQSMQLANYSDISQYIGGTAWKFSTSELSYDNVTTSINQAFNLPIINSNLCILYIYLSASFSDDSTNSTHMYIKTNDDTSICYIESKYYQAYTAKDCNTLIYDTINNYGCGISNNNYITSQMQINMPLKLFFDNTYISTVSHIYARCSLLWLA